MLYMGKKIFAGWKVRPDIVARFEQIADQINRTRPDVKLGDVAAAALLGFVEMTADEKASAISRMQSYGLAEDLARVLPGVESEAGKKAGRQAAAASQKPSHVAKSPKSSATG